MYSHGYEAVIGLEIHAQLKTDSKIFSSDSTKFDASDNENTSPVSVGMPGTLPVLNKSVIDFTILTGLALNCTIRNKSVFARKNYFYPDLPKGYQISQYDEPTCENGYVDFVVDGVDKRVNIQRAHIEEDAGKSTHFGEYTLINLNRAGIPLLEIVSHPDIKSGREASEYAKAVRQILRYLKVCDGNLEEGSLRCDCNVSVRKVGDSKLGTKVEIKNVNSFRFVEKAIDYEVERQIDAITSGEKIYQETRLWDPDKNKTFVMRTKEDAQDYRYFPDPDLLALIIDDSEIERKRNLLPELPLQKSKRFNTSFGLSIQDANLLTEEKEIAEFFEKSLETSGYPKSTANWILTELLRELNSHHVSISNSPVTPENLGLLVNRIESGSISGKIGKIVFEEMWKTSAGPDEIIKSKGLIQITDDVEIDKIIDAIIAANPNQVAEYRSGKDKLFGFFVGQIMKASKGQASPEVTNVRLKAKLGG